MSRTYLGTILIDSGCLAIHDPAYTGELVAKLNPVEDHEAIEFDNGQNGAAIVVHVPGGDGQYPVWLEQGSDGIYRITIELNYIPTEAEAEAIAAILAGNK